MEGLIPDGSTNCQLSITGTAHARNLYHGIAKSYLRLIWILLWFVATLSFLLSLCGSHRAGMTPLSFPLGFSLFLVFALGNDLAQRLQIEGLTEGALVDV